MLKAPDHNFIFYLIDLAAIKGGDNAASGEGLVCKVPLPDDAHDSMLHEDAFEIADQLKTLAWVSHDALLPLSLNLSSHFSTPRRSVSSSGTTAYGDPDRYSYSYATNKMLYNVRVEDNLLFALACRLSGPNLPPLVPLALLSQLLDTLRILFVAAHGPIRDFIQRESVDANRSLSQQRSAHFAISSSPIRNGNDPAKRVSLVEVKVSLLYTFYFSFWLTYINISTI